MPPSLKEKPHVPKSFRFVFHIWTLNPGKLNQRKQYHARVCPVLAENDRKIGRSGRENHRRCRSISTGIRAVVIHAKVS